MLGGTAIQVHSLLQKRTDSGQLVLLGKIVCAAAWRRLMAVGSGRFERLQRAARLDEPPPMDGRFLSKKKLRGSKKRARIVEFLEELYHTAAEPMPTLAAPGEEPPADTPQQAVQREQDARPWQKAEAFSPE